MDIEKSRLRKKLKSKRLALGFDQQAELSTVIVYKLKSCIDWSGIKTLHCFEPILRLREVDTTKFIEDVWAEHPQINCFTSRLVKQKWQITSFAGEVQSKSLKLDVIIVPMLGFDPQLHRIGYGGGYYDRLLAEHPEAQKIGVCFESGRVEDIPNEPHDIAMDKIVTESASY